MAGGLALAYVDRHLVPADRTSWDFSDIFSGVENLAIPVVGFVLAARRPANRIGWLFLAVGLALGLSRFADQYGLRALVADPRAPAKSGQHLMIACRGRTGRLAW
jgi:hypothetical protein